MMSERERGGSLSGQVWGMLIISLAKCDNVHKATQESDRKVSRVPRHSGHHLSILSLTFLHSPGPTVSTEKSRLLVILLPVTGPIHGP